MRTHEHRTQVLAREICELFGRCFLRSRPNIEENIYVVSENGGNQWGDRNQNRTTARTNRKITHSVDIKFECRAYVVCMFERAKPPIAYYVHTFSARDKS